MKSTKNIIFVLSFISLITGCGPSSEFTKMETELSYLKKDLAETSELLAQTKEQLQSSSLVNSKLTGELEAVRQQLKAAEAIVNSIPKTSTVRGQLFITTKGAGSYEFSGVAVNAYEREAYLNYLDSKKEELYQRAMKLFNDTDTKDKLLDYARMETEAERYDEQIERYKEEEIKISEEQLELGYGAGSYEARSLLADKSSAISRKRSAVYEKKWALYDKQRDLNLQGISSQYKELVNINEYLDSDIQPVANTRSNSNGEFELVIPKDIDVVVVSTATRLHDEKTEIYAWVESVRVVGKPMVKIFLTGDNVVTSSSHPNYIRCFAKEQVSSFEYISVFSEFLF